MAVGGPKGEGVGRTRSQKNPLPFAAIPYAMAEDRRLKPIDIAVAIQILKRLQNGASGWVFNGVIARVLGCDSRTVQRATARLEDAGWFTYEKGPDNPRAQRKITAQWRVDGFQTGSAGVRDDVAATSPLSPLGTSPVSPNKEPLIENLDREGGPQPAHQSSREITLSRERERGGVLSDEDGFEFMDRLRERLATLADVNAPRRRKAKLVDATAGDLAGRLWDDHSKGRYCRMLWDVADGRTLPAEVLEAFEAAHGGMAEKVGVAGSYFFGTIDNKRSNRAHVEIEEAFRAENREQPPRR